MSFYDYTSKRCLPCIINFALINSFTFYTPYSDVYIEIEIVSTDVSVEIEGIVSQVNYSADCR